MASKVPSDFAALLQHHRATERENKALRHANQQMRSALFALRAEDLPAFLFAYGCCATAEAVKAIFKPLSKHVTL